MSERNNVKNVRYRISFPIKLSVILLVSSIVSGVIFQNFVSYSIGDTYANSMFVIKSVKDFLVPSLWFSITIFTLLFSLGTILVSILVSHKIAGPLYRLENTFSDFKEGIFYTINLRPKDQVQDFVDILNGFVESLSERFSSVKKSSLSIHELMSKVKSECGKDGIDFQSLDSINAELKSAVSDLKGVLDQYTT